MLPPPPRSTLFPYTTLFRSCHCTPPPSSCSRSPRIHARAPRSEAGETERRSEEHTSELQSLRHLVCRLLLEKKKKKEKQITTPTESNKNQKRHDKHTQHTKQ